jgi:major type 1 subunit fimbrin (pilin)
MNTTKHLHLIAPLAATLIALPLSAHAVDGTINITGQISQSTCAVSADSQNLTVTLPPVSTSALGPSQIAGNTAFQIQLTGCTPAAGTVHAFFEAGASVLPDGHLANEGSAAQGVEILLTNADGTPILAGLTDALQGADAVAVNAAGAATLNYAAAYIGNGAPLVPGAVKTFVNYSISYN